MKRWLLFISIFLMLFGVIGCSSDQSNNEKYYVLVVQGDENISDKFGEFAGNPVLELEYLTSLEVANEKYPENEIERAPAVFIFETGGGEMKRLEFKTYNVDEAIDFLKEAKE
ncbi:hypothetical protein ACFOGI_05420 [Virgibacillus xinjiangensis]|uniref:Thioredoxin n=1 Tax=Virgibacillus xinjiangensis TaxID=393090 RepID=A0ABV7CU50_9BACI